MAHRGKLTRIEPTFDGPARGREPSGFSVGEEDRVVPSNRKPAGGRKKSAKARAAKSRRRSGGAACSAGRAGCSTGASCWRIWGGIAAAGIVVYYGAQMPSVADWAVPDRPPNVKIVSVDGKLVANRGMTGGEAVGLHEMSPYIPQAVIAIEDRRFYSHFGVDPIGLARAMVNNLTHGRFSQGGSTLTQQLAKNLFLKPDRTLERKVQEVLLALWLEHKHSKDQILEMYLNRVYFGSGAYGVEAASRRYFGKIGARRDAGRSRRCWPACSRRRRSCRRRAIPRPPRTAPNWCWPPCASEGMIGDKELTTAMSAPATRAASYWTGSENYVADRIMEELPGLIGEVRDDIIVDTTVDLDLQKLAEKSIRRLIDENGKKLNVSQGALVSIDNSTGAVRAMVGGYDYADSQFDRASEARAPAGLGVQAVRLPGGARTGPHARQRAQRRADQDRQMDARQLQRQILWQRHAGDRAGEIAELGRRAAGHGGRPRQRSSRRRTAWASNPSCRPTPRSRSAPRR